MIEYKYKEAEEVRTKDGAMEALKYALVLIPVVGVVPFLVSTMQNKKSFDDDAAGLCLGIWNGLILYSTYKLFL